jgi:hypothetical protein
VNRAKKEIRIVFNGLPGGVLTISKFITPLFSFRDNYSKKKAGLPLFQGNPAILFLGPAAFRPPITQDLALSWDKNKKSL